MKITNLSEKPKRERVTFRDDTIIDKEGILSLLTAIDNNLKAHYCELEVTLDSNGEYEVFVNRKKITRTRKSNKKGLLGYDNVFNR